MIVTSALHSLPIVLFVLTKRTALDDYEYGIMRTIAAGCAVSGIVLPPAAITVADAITRFVL